MSQVIPDSITLSCKEENARNGTQVYNELKQSITLQKKYIELLEIYIENQNIQVENYDEIKQLQVELKNSPTFETDMKFIQKLNEISKKQQVELSVIKNQAQEKINMLVEQIFELFGPLITQKEQLRIQIEDIKDIQARLSHQKRLAQSGVFRCCYQSQVDILQVELDGAIKLEEGIRQKIKKFDAKHQDDFEKLYEKRDSINQLLQNLITKDYFEMFQSEFNRSMSQSMQPDIVQEFPVLPQYSNVFGKQSSLRRSDIITAPCISDTMVASSLRENDVKKK